MLAHVLRRPIRIHTAFGEAETYGAGEGGLGWALSVSPGGSISVSAGGYSQKVLSLLREALQKGLVDFDRIVVGAGTGAARGNGAGAAVAGGGGEQARLGGARGSG